MFRAEGDLDSALELFEEDERKLSQENLKRFIDITKADQDVATSYIERSDQQTSVASWIWAFAHEQQP